MLHNITRRLPSTSLKRAYSVESSTPKEETLKGWRKHAHQFRDKPASYLLSFAILHEVTAVLPLPIVYYTLKWTHTSIPIPQGMIEQQNAVVSRVRKYYGYEPLDPSSRTMINMATAYAVVKLIMPLRVGVCLAATPWTATSIMTPIYNTFKRLSTKLVRRSVSHLYIPHYASFVCPFIMRGSRTAFVVARAHDNTCVNQISSTFCPVKS
ncbi:hypothetical protein PROFUN_10699 [Planoprotostelium fungivorum]|uniref:Uncharacterized protein n=1 Tax=Planoprotostelium fungivorum TaxID=1890364 RepID=A0A2P6N9K9_9EUKA|nr:hypothetical protein PROFUN_10699 [Planoprotostelium fungivorum]